MDENKEGERFWGKEDGLFVDWLLHAYLRGFLRRLTLMFRDQNPPPLPAHGCARSSGAWDTRGTKFHGGVKYQKLLHKQVLYDDLAEIIF